MKADKLVRMMIKLRLGPMQVHPDGRITFHLLEPAFWLLELCILVGISAFCYVRIRSQDSWDAYSIAMLAITLPIAASMCLSGPLVSLAFIKTEHLDYYKHGRVGVGHLSRGLVAAALLFGTCYVGNQDLLAKGDAGITCLTLVVMGLGSLPIMIFVFGMLCITEGIKARCLNTVQQPCLSLEDINRLTEHYNRMKVALGPMSFIPVCFNQVMIIFSLFLILYSEPLFPLLTTSFIIFVLTGYIFDVDSVYTALAEVVRQGHDHAHKAHDLRSLLALKDALAGLEASGPLSGLGFFPIERSTLLGMMSTTLTYIIILIQLKPMLD